MKKIIGNITAAYYLYTLLLLRHEKLKLKNLLRFIDYRTEKFIENLNL